MNEAQRVVDAYDDHVKGQIAAMLGCETEDLELVADIPAPSAYEQRRLRKAAFRKYQVR